MQCAEPCSISVPLTLIAFILHVDTKGPKIKINAVYISMSVLDTFVQPIDFDYVLGLAN